MQAVKHWTILTFHSDLVLSRCHTNPFVGRGILDNESNIIQHHTFSLHQQRTVITGQGLEVTWLMFLSNGSCFQFDLQTQYLVKCSQTYYKWKSDKLLLFSFWHKMIYSLSFATSSAAERELGQRILMSGSTECDQQYIHGEPIAMHSRHISNVSEDNYTAFSPTWSVLSL